MKPNLSAFATVFGSEAGAEFLLTLAHNIVQLADIVERADQYDPDFVVQTIYAIRAAQIRIDEFQSPTFGPN